MTRRAARRFRESGLMFWVACLAGSDIKELNVLEYARPRPAGLNDPAIISAVVSGGQLCIPTQPCFEASTSSIARRSRASQALAVSLRRTGMPICVICVSPLSAMNLRTNEFGGLARDLSR